MSPIEKTVQAWVLNEEKKYIGLQPLVEDDVFSTAIIPGLVIDMKEVFLD